MITLTIFVLILLAGVQGDIKILNTPDGIIRPEPCARICSGVEKEYSGWSLGTGDSFSHRVYKDVYMSDCDFISPAVITVTSRSAYWPCPTFSIWRVYNNRFTLFTVPDLPPEIESHRYIPRNLLPVWMERNQCSIYWTAVGFVC